MKFQNKVYTTLPLGVVACSGWLEGLGSLEIKPKNSKDKDGSSSRIHFQLYYRKQIAGNCVMAYIDPPKLRIQQDRRTRC